MAIVRPWPSGGRRSWKEALAPFKALEQQWIGQWNTAAGEDIRYMPRSTAKRDR